MARISSCTAPRTILNSSDNIHSRPGRKGLPQFLRGSEPATSTKSHASPRVQAVVPYREPAWRSTRYLRLCLDVLTTPTPCSVPWDTMDGAEGSGCTRICPECMQEIHDVSSMEPVAAEAFLGEHVTETPSSKLRLRLHRRPDGRVMAAECARGAGERRQRRIAAGVIVFAALSAAVMLLRLF